MVEKTINAKVLDNNTCADKGPVDKLRNDQFKIVLLTVIAIVLVVTLVGKGLTPDNYQYFLSRRLPKVLAMILAGTAIALSSMAFQTITHNRILTPSIMGFDSLYVLIQVMIAFFVGGLSQFLLNPYLNFIICVSLMIGFSLTLFKFYFRSGRKNIIVLLLMGVVLSQLFSNFSTMFAMMLDPNEYTMVQSTMFASFNNVQAELIYISLPIITFCAVCLFRMNALLNVFWLDHDNATSLGVDVANVSKQVLILSSILIAVSTALVGPVLFFGLLVTNLAREWLRTYQHNMLFIACSLLAIVALLLGQFVIENLLNFQTTLSVVINFLGGLYFLRILLTNRIM
ncbi:iron chelate uptake ABC transporter family permease subunit [Vibrio sp. MA40-2]|uniref:iron chelate uptake ABC transporter family permease subunit n=1 Tax=Vibrio sp. MA40-2 TaxID=3391828 RepID=UPI0039A517B2